MATADELIKAYVQVRDQKKELADMHKQQMDPFNHKLAVLDTALLNVLHTAGADSIKGKSGTAYINRRVNVGVDDWDAALAFVLDNDLHHMLEKRVAKASVMEYVEANGAAPPGVSVNTTLAIGVRRS